ncbi:MAG TPA: polysaccharide deacetylase family protein [Bryobacteraceae bacterium]|nr:polysaccharide deacetylase family protein [Bryobacteraceae bacterium]
MPRASWLEQMAPRGFILCFHEISPRRFSELIGSLRGFRAVHLNELTARARAGKSTAGLFAITVDDGVGDNVRGLSAALVSHGWPGTFYLPTGYLDSGMGMPFQWFFKLRPLLPGKVFRLKSEVLDFRSRGAVARLSERLETLWRTQPLDAYWPLITELVDTVERDCTVSRKALEPPAPISWPEVSALSRSELIRFESHGVTHIAVSALKEDELDREMQRSRERIEQHTGRPCRHFCYPFGSAEAIGSHAPRAVRRFYDSAVTLSMGPVDDADPWLLPRIPLYEKNSRLFVGLKIALKCTPVRTVFPYRSYRFAEN